MTFKVNFPSIFMSSYRITFSQDFMCFFVRVCQIKVLHAYLFKNRISMLDVGCR